MDSNIMGVIRSEHGFWAKYISVLEAIVFLVDPHYYVLLYLMII